MLSSIDLAIHVLAARTWRYSIHLITWDRPNTLVLKMIDFLTFSKCLSDIKNSCLTPDLKKCKTYTYYLDII